MPKNEGKILENNSQNANNALEREKTNNLEQYKNKIYELENEIETIKERNKRVELDKKWETSFTRRFCICIITYLIVLIYSFIIKDLTTIAIIFSSIVPVIGFILSTLSLKLIRKLWEKKYKNG